MKTTATLQLPGFLKSLRWLALICACLLITAAHARVRRVDSASTAINPIGITWQTAYNDLQAAIDASTQGDEIWIARGTYQPGSGTSFQMRSGVNIYGGFTNTMTQLSQRNWVTNKVILKGNNASVIANTNLSSGILDGVTISNGNGNYGGGINNSNSSFTINNGIIEGNTGGGVYNSNSSLSITNVTIRNNQSFFGGGIYNSNSSLSITNATIENNSGLNGGGIYSNCTNSSSIVIANILFRNNKAKVGGGMYNIGGSAATLTINNAVFAGNTVTDDSPGAVVGGGLYTSVMSVNITNTVFYANAVLRTQSNPAPGGGGGIYNDNSVLRLNNCTFLTNVLSYGSYSNEGSAIYNSTQFNGSSPLATVVNCIFWGNSNSFGRTPIYDYLPSGSYQAANVTYSYLQTARGGAGNITGTVSPFVNEDNPDGTDNVWMTLDDGLQLSLCNAAAAVDKGNNAAISLATDITGRPRKWDVDFIPNGGSGTAPVVDMGAYENQASAASIPGTIGNAHMIPYPQELTPDYITSVTNPASGTIVSWEKKEDNGNNNWVAATPASSNLTYSISTAIENYQLPPGSHLLRYRLLQQYRSDKRSRPNPRTGR